MPNARAFLLLSCLACRAAPSTRAPDVMDASATTASTETPAQLFDRVAPHHPSAFTCPSGTTLRATTDDAHYTFFCENAAGKKHGFFLVYGRDGTFEVEDVYSNGEHLHGVCDGIMCFRGQGCVAGKCIDDAGGAPNCGVIACAAPCRCTDSAIGVCVCK